MVDQRLCNEGCRCYGAKMEQLSASLVHLVGRQTSVVFECELAGAPLWRYWGARLPEDIKASPLRNARPLPSFSLDDDQPLSIFPCFGVGWFAQSALLADCDTLDFAQAITRSEVAQQSAHAVQFSLYDDVARISAILNYTLDPASDVLTVSTAVRNDGDAPLALHWAASATLLIPAQAANVQYYTGRHNAEFQRQEIALGRSIWRRENRRGLTSHDIFPGAVVTMPGTTLHQGIAYSAQLAWSGNSAQSIEWLDDGHFQWQLGEWLAPGEVRLKPGETYVAPNVLATCSVAGIDGAARNFHAAIRQRMSWPTGTMLPRRVHLNTWEGLYFNHDEAALHDIVDRAADLGVERFVLDDGWFHGRDDDTRALGDWWPDANKYPDGLAPLAAHVIARGLAFGLWIEPEMVNPDSDLFRAHPEWALQIAGRRLLTARNQLVLDLTRSEVSEYLFDCVARLLTTLPISYLKWDHNRDLTAAGNVRGSAAYRQQVLAAYALIDRLRLAHPHVEIEACAGGGGRIDAGIVSRTHRFWTSDCIDAASRLAIQNGFLQFFPPEIMGAHVGAAQAHSTGRHQSLDFRAAVALPGSLGIELDPRTLDAEDQARLVQWIALYKELRNALHHGQVWRGEAGDNLSWQAHGDGNQWLLFVYRVDPTCQRHMPTVMLPFVTPDVGYAVTVIAPEAETQAVAHDGAWLAAIGLPLPPIKAETAIIFRIVAL